MADACVLVWSVWQGRTLIMGERRGTSPVSSLADLVMDALERLLRGAEEVTHQVASFLSAPAVVDRAGWKLLGDREVQCCL